MPYSYDFTRWRSNVMWEGCRIARCCSICDRTGPLRWEFPTPNWPARKRPCGRFGTLRNRSCSRCARASNAGDASSSATAAPRLFPDGQVFSALRAAIFRSSAFQSRVLTSSGICCGSTALINLQRLLGGVDDHKTIGTFSDVRLQAALHVGIRVRIQIIVQFLRNCLQVSKDVFPFPLELAGQLLPQCQAGP